MPRDLIPHLELSVFFLTPDCFTRFPRVFSLSGDLAFLVLSLFFVVFDFTCLLGADDAFFGFAFLLGVNDFLANASCTVVTVFFLLNVRILFWARDN